MRRCFFSLITIFLTTAFAIGQDAKPTPTPTPDNDVVKITTNLIQVDVIVTDSKGKPVTDLKPEEIEIYENGEKQQITNFSFITSVREKVEKPKEKEKDPSALPEPPKVLREREVRRAFALVVDDLSLSFESAYYTRRALKKFVDEQMQDGDLVAIIRTGSGIGALQQFTADKRMLYAAIEKVKWNAMGSGGISVFAPIESPAAGIEQSQNETDETGLTGGESLDDFRSRVFATGTLGALRYVINGMSDLPGRKSVILFSHGFRMVETDDEGTIRGSSTVFDYIKVLVEAANRAAVTFYAIDPRGLQYTGLTAADDVGGMTQQQIFAATSARSRQLNETQDGLKYLARETGGFAVVNNNDIAGGIRRVVEDHSYYLVGYDPDTDTFDPVRRRFNKLEVKVLRKGVTVRYRSGFFNVADRERTRETNVATNSAQTPINQLVNALVSPFAVNGINLKFNALFGSDAKNGAYVRSVLHVDTADMKFTDEPNGEKKVVFDVLAMSFGDNGQVVDQLGKTYTLNLNPKSFKNIAERGFVYHFMFPVKKPGAYQYRVALRDTQGGRIGSASQFIEVPNLKKKRLSLSSIVIQSLSPGEWKAMNTPASTTTTDSDPMADTALRRVKLGTILRYGFEIYNAKLDGAKQPRLTTKIRVFHEGKVILDGKQMPLDLRGQTNFTVIKTSGAISIGTEMLPGDYILQIITTDELADKKKQIAAQFIQFEVVG